MNLPSHDDILQFLAESPAPATKRELSQAFGIKGDARRPFREQLRKMVKKGLIEKQDDGAFALPDALPETTTLVITDMSLDGEMIAIPTDRIGSDDKDIPTIYVIADTPHTHDLQIGTRILARLRKVDADEYDAHIMRVLDSAETRIIGLVRKNKKGYLLTPANKKAKDEYIIPDQDMGDAKEGDLVTASIQPTPRGMSKKFVRILDVIGHESDRKIISILSAYENGLNEEFPPDVVAATVDMSVPELGKRQDLRTVPLVTIDGEDARDFDDAVFAEQTDDGGFHLIVAIADVSYYVRPASDIDNEAYRRGNSTYFPDRVIPMLPERLCNDLCSLRPDEERACLAAHMWIDKTGALQKYKFVRGLMKSKARLTYTQVQSAKDGLPDDQTEPLMDAVINPLYKAFDILLAHREERGALDLDLPERQIVINDNNEMAGVTLRTRFDSHRLIEEFMILANVAAASALEDKDAPCVYRVHEKPDATKLDGVRDFLEAFDLSFPKGQVVRSPQINALLRKAGELPYSHMISEVILRTQSQAHYSTNNKGHFGLALQRYAHFTSPIRRYADLLVHRSLIKAYKLGEGGLSDEESVTMEEKSEHISDTERKSVNAERSAVDRFTSAFLSDKIGEEFSGRITGVTRFGLFVQLADTGADGFIPMRSMKNDYYEHVERQHALIGRRHGRIFRLGAKIDVRLIEADPLTGSTILELANDKGADIEGANFQKASRAKHNNDGKKQHKKPHKHGKKGRKSSYGKKNAPHKKKKNFKKKQK